jgi:uncharacterized protein YifN (PemK superfamily)|tara:strand:- start:1314 stop:1736 length:423 start_codon:yes stop_codon:yes gene_type:complete
MALHYNPEPGTIVICDFHGFIVPEMIKRRPVLIVSPRLRNREGLCTIVPFSTTTPTKIMPYHYRLHLDPPLPSPYTTQSQWVKCDMIYTVAFERLYLLRAGKDSDGKRIYDVRVVDKADLIKINECILHGLGMASLTKYL